MGRAHNDTHFKCLVDDPGVLRVVNYTVNTMTINKIKCNILIDFTHGQFLMGKEHSFSSISARLLKHLPANLAVIQDAAGKSAGEGSKLHRWSSEACCLTKSSRDSGYYCV